MLGVGEEIKLIATISPSAVEEKLTWSSIDNSVAEVDEIGNVTAKKAGTTVIKVEASNGVLAVCNVDVVVKTGSIEGVVTWKYNDYIGNKPDTGADVILISTTVKNLPKEIGLGMTHTSKDIEGIYSVQVSGAGTYAIENIPVGEYYLIIISYNVMPPDFMYMTDIMAKAHWGKVYDLFSEEGKKNAIIQAKANAVYYNSVTIMAEKTITCSHDFGKSFI